MITIFSAPRVRQVLASKELLHKLWTWTIAGEVEISALGEIGTVNDTLRVLDRVHLLKQEGSGGHTRIDSLVLADLLTREAQAGRDTQNTCAWYHSHPSMSVFFSQTDINNILELRKSMPVVVAGVFNEKGESHWALVQKGSWIEWDLDCREHMEKPSLGEIHAAKTKLSKYVTKKKSFWKGLTYKSKSSGLCWEMFNKEYCSLKSEHPGPCYFPNQGLSLDMSDSTSKKSNEREHDFGGYL